MIVQPADKRVLNEEPAAVNKRVMKGSLSKQLQTMTPFKERP